MNVTRTSPASFTATFESEEELRREHETNLAFGGLSLPTEERAEPEAQLEVTLRGPWGGEVALRAKVVAALPGALALGVEADPDALLAALLIRPAAPPAPRVRDEGADATNPWDRIRSLSQMEKILLAVKADRTERALLLQDNDPRVLLSILRNPRLTIEEVGRLAKSSFLTYQIADVIMQAAQWMSSLEVRLGLIHNPKTPQAFALRILPTLPDADVRAIARSATSMALKQAALRRLQK
jgi:hypothetical protein